MIQLVKKYIILILSFLMTVFYSCNKESDKKEEVFTKIEQSDIPKFEFGFNLDLYDVLVDTIKSGDSFGKILYENHIDFGQIEKIVNATKDTFDVKRLNIGKRYTLLRSKDSIQKTKYFIYQPNQINYVVFDLENDSLPKAYNARKPIKTVEREASGVIKKSLSESMDKSGLNMLVAYEISDIYAWSIDFFRLQKGDKYKVIFEERYINDSVYVDVGNIKAVMFEHKGTPFYAFNYKIDSIPEINDYYDEKGKTLRSQFLKAPVDFYRISSRYSPRRFHPVQKRWKAHKGTDYAAAKNTQIKSTANGTVIASSRKLANGNYVKVRHNSTYTTQYLHMNKRAVKVGDVVKQGDVIGYVGKTGLATGYHVCYRFWKNGKQVDPLKEKLPSAKPIKESLKADYLKFIKPIKGQLDAINYELE
jgi:murein DD-endopeptidase MepM/ murein hydrolase activator NlpD